MWPLEIYTLSLHDALPIWKQFHGRSTASGEPYDMFQFTAAHCQLPLGIWVRVTNLRIGRDRKSTRLNSSHVKNSYAVFCLKKKSEEPPALTKYSVNHMGTS